MEFPTFQDPHELLGQSVMSTRDLAHVKDASQEATFRRPPGRRLLWQVPIVGVGSSTAQLSQQGHDGEKCPGATFAG